MFQGFLDDTVQFLIDLKFHNNSTFFHENHDRYVESVQVPFYEMIEKLAPQMKKIDPQMETRPYKCISRIHRDTRFSKDKSPYRDHHWFLFRRAGESRDKSLFYYFEFGPDRLSWGMGIWGENRELMDYFRKKMRANPESILQLLESIQLSEHCLIPSGSVFKRMEVPDEIPEELRRWYTAKELYVEKYKPAWKTAFSENIVKVVSDDFIALAPLYRLLRGYADEIHPKG